MNAFPCEKMEDRDNIWKNLTLRSDLDEKDKKKIQSPPPPRIGVLVPKISRYRRSLFYDQSFVYSVSTVVILTILDLFFTNSILIFHDLIDTKEFILRLFLRSEINRALLNK